MFEVNLKMRMGLFLISHLKLSMSQQCSYFLGKSSRCSYKMSCYEKSSVLLRKAI